MRKLFEQGFNQAEHIHFLAYLKLVYIDDCFEVFERVYLSSTTVDGFRISTTRHCNFDYSFVVAAGHGIWQLYANQLALSFGSIMLFGVIAEV